MSPIKSSLARTVGRLLGVQKDTDLSLRGDVQSNRKITSLVHLVELKYGGTTVFLGSSGNGCY